MSKRALIRKLTLGPSEQVTARTSLAGYMILADYLDPVTNQRTLVLERPHVGKSPVASPRKPKVGKAVDAQPDSAIPGYKAPNIMSAGATNT